MITVNLFGVFRVETGQKSFTLDVADGTTIGKTILQIIDLYPLLKKYWIGADGGLSGHVMVVLNGLEIYSQPDGLQTPVKQGDRLDFFSPLAGG
jgi:molybdopterin converting factor small subunit